MSKEALRSLSDTAWLTLRFNQMLEIEVYV